MLARQGQEGKIAPAERARSEGEGRGNLPLDEPLNAGVRRQRCQRGMVAVGAATDDQPEGKPPRGGVPYSADRSSSCVSTRAHARLLLSDGLFEEPVSQRLIHSQSVLLADLHTAVRVGGVVRAPTSTRRACRAAIQSLSVRASLARLPFLTSAQALPLLSLWRVVSEANEALSLSC